MRSKYLILGLVIVFVFGVTYYDYTQKQKVAKFWNQENGICEVGKGCSDIKVRPGYGVGDTIPNLTLYTPDQQKVKLYDIIKGKKNIYINLTTDWCEDCQQEHEILPELVSNASSDTIIIPVFVNYRSDKTNTEQMTQYIKDKNFDFPVYVDVNNDFLNRFKVNGTPTNIYINQSGRIKIIGQELALDQLINDTQSEGE